MYLFPDGEVRSCCVSTYSLGNVRRSGLAEIWHGERHRRLVEHLDRHDFALGCESCGSEVAIEGRAGSYPAQFDWLGAAEPGAPDGPAPMADDGWPTAIGFYLSNTCNLQCVQCNGENSSAIRKHRERRPPLGRSYDEAFFEQLPPFLRHLRAAFFVGGEPFLSPELFRVWELMAEVGVRPECSVVTNGTQWNERVEAALEQVPCSITVSLDGASRETFERIRVGADFDVVMANLDHFARYTRRVGTSLNINHCLMPDNAHEFADLLLLGDERDVDVRVCVVRDPAEHSIARLPQEQIAAIHRRLLADEDRIAHRLVRNRRTWETELARIGTWATCDPTDIGQVAGTSPHRLVMFRRAGSGPHDDAAARARLAERAPGAAFAEVVVGDGDRVVATSAGFDELVGLGAGALVGRPAIDIQAAMVDRFGRMRSWEILEQDDDEAYSVGRFADVEVRCMTVAERGPDGWARQVRIICAALPATS